MAELSESQLILLDNLIYLKGVANSRDKTVGEIVDDLLNNNKLSLSKDPRTGKYPGSMSRDEWIGILKNIERDPQLKGLTVLHGDPGFVYDENGKIVQHKQTPLEVGARMATFVDLETDEAVVVFRGTSGDAEWHDNGTGGYLSDTEMQKRALEYVESLPYSNITVTGHSKGGNKAQYVGILSDKVKRVVSLDGQGFSKDFVEKYKDLIEANKHKITSISASDDPVNSLLIPVAGTIKYIQTSDPDNPLDIFYYHKPNIVLNEKGELNDETEQGAVSKFLNDFTIYASTTMQEPFRSYVLDGLLALKESGQEGTPKESLTQSIISAVIALSHLDDFALSKVSDKYGNFAELVAAALGTAVFPYIFIDDLLHSVWENLNDLKDYVVAKVKQFGDWLNDTMDAASKKFKEFGEHIGAAFLTFAQQIKNGWGAMVQGMNHFFADLRQAGEAVMQKLNRFMDKFSQGVQNFCNWIAEGTRKAIEAAKNAWNSSVDKVKSWFGDVQESISNKAGELKDGIKHVAVMTREGFRKFIDASVTKAKEIGNWLVTKLDQARKTAIEIGAKVSAAFTAMADKLKAGWESVKTGMANLAGNIKETAVRVAEAMARFAQTLSRAVKSFCDKIVAAYKRMMEGLKQGWDNLVGNITTLFSKATNLIRQEVDEFKDNVNSAVSMARDKVTDLGKRAIKGIKGFTGKVVKGLSKISGGLLMVSVNRLTDLQTKFKRTDDDVVSTTSRIVNDAERIASNVSRAYSESNVQSQVRQLQRAIDDVRNRRNQVAAEMQRKIRSLAMARDQYVRIERMLKSNMGNLT